MGVSRAGATAKIELRFHNRWQHDHDFPVVCDCARDCPCCAWLYFVLECFVQISRGYYSLFAGWWGGLGLVARVANNSTAKAQWKQFVDQRYNISTQITSFPPYADALDPHWYVLQDVMPFSSDVAPIIGIDLSAAGWVRSTLQQLMTPQTLNTSNPVPFYGTGVAVSGLNEVWPGYTGMFTFTTVFDDDPTKYLVMTATVFDTYFQAVRDVSPESAVVIRDHVGKALTGGNCDISEVDQALKRHVRLTDSVTWTVELGQCPGFKSTFVTWRRYVILAVCLCTTVLALVVCLFVMAFQDKIISQAVERTRNQEKANAHQIVVGYICHELRNPLHIIKTSFRALVAGLKSVNPGFSSRALHHSSTLDTMDGPEEALLAVDEEPPTDDDLLSIIGDAHTALQQMQTTVNEVLDFRAIDSGLSSLKLNRELHTLGQVWGDVWGRWVWCCIGCIVMFVAIVPPTSVCSVLTRSASCQCCFDVAHFYQRGRHTSWYYVIPMPPCLWTV